MSCTLYRFYDDEDTLLYVGISEHPLTRLAMHDMEKEWWSEVSRATFCHYFLRDDAIDAEREAIRNENPVFNVRENVAPGSSARLDAWHERLNRRAIANYRSPMDALMAADESKRRRRR